MFSLDHIGIATEDPEALGALMEALAGLHRFTSETISEQGVTAHFLPAGHPAHPSPTLELLEPEDVNSTVARFLKKRGPGMHHLALRVPSVNAAMQRATALNLRLLSDEPHRGAGGKRVAFLHPKDTGGVLIELCEHTDPLPDPEPVSFAHDGARGTLAAYRFGSAERPPLLLLHGAAGCTQLETLPLAHRLAPHFHVVAFDFPGHGGSDPFAECDFTPSLFVASARAVLDHFDMNRAGLFGFSMGGIMALHVARQHPERTGRLAVHGACLTWTEAQAEKLAARLNADALRSQNARMAHTLDAAHSDWQHLFARTERFVRTLPARTAAMRHRVAALEHPTLVSTVDRDDLFPLEALLALHRCLPDARLAVVPGRHHALARTDLGALLPPLVEHLRPEQH